MYQKQKLLNRLSMAASILPEVPYLVNPEGCDLTTQVEAWVCEKMLTPLPSLFDIVYTKL